MKEKCVGFLEFKVALRCDVAGINIGISWSADVVEALSFLRKRWIFLYARPPPQSSESSIMKGSVCCIGVDLNNPYPSEETVGDLCQKLEILFVIYHLFKDSKVIRCFTIIISIFFSIIYCVLAFEENHPVHISRRTTNR